MISQNIYPRIYIALDVAHNFLVVNQQQKCSVKLLIHEGLMRKLATLVASFAVLWGSHAASESIRGEAAVELIIKAHKRGVIVRKEIINNADKTALFELMLDGRFYQCNVEARDQWCNDQTGYQGKYEE
jgi:hypothetical protein